MGSKQNFKIAPKPSIYETKGVCGTIRYAGSVASRSVAYLGVKSLQLNNSPGSVLWNVCGAILRHICKNEINWEFSHPGEVMVTYQQNNTAFSLHPLIGMRLIFRYADYSKTIAPDSWVQDEIRFTNSTSPYAKTVNTIIEEMNTILRQRMSASKGSTDANILVFAGYQPIFNSTSEVLPSAANQTVGPFRNLEDLFIRCYSTANIRVQNQTRADSGANAATDLVNTNPLVCKILKFSDPYWIAREARKMETSGTTSIMTLLTNWWRLADASGDGIINPTNDASWLDTGGGDSSALQLPTASMFMNATKETKFQIVPGGIRGDEIRFKFSGRLNRLLQGLMQDLNAQSIGSVGYRPVERGFNRSLGTSKLYAFDKLMADAGASTVNPSATVTFDITFSAGAVVTGKSAVVWQRYQKNAEAADKDS